MVQLNNIIGTWYRKKTQTKITEYILHYQTKKKILSCIAIYKLRYY